MYATEINQLCDERGWKRARLVLELRKAARARGQELPDDGSLRRMIRTWANGSRGLSEHYAELLTVVFGVPFTKGRPEDQAEDGAASTDDAATGLSNRLTIAARVDIELVELLEAQTQTYRLLDRRLGATRLLSQTEGQLGQMTDLLAHSLPGGCREALAAAVAECAALAGWQALDLGNPEKAWQHHETAKAAARESRSPAILAHVTAQQAYALLDLERGDAAVQLIEHARSESAGRLPALLDAWLCAALGETYAATGADAMSRKALDRAALLLPAKPAAEELPFLALDDVHLARWRGHCLARLGAAEAVDDLSHALARLDPNFARAAAGLQCDLAMAHIVRGEHDVARAHAETASHLAAQTASRRQHQRIRRLLKNSEQPPR